jgi:phospholipid/cholesterol/gamma-HCH transport system permease protein
MSLQPSWKNGSAWQLEARRRGEDTLELQLSGRWCLDERLPRARDLHDTLFPGLATLRLHADALGQWDTGLPTFVAGLVRLGREHHFVVDQSRLPPGVQRLLTMALAGTEPEAGRSHSAPRGVCDRLGRSLLDFVGGAPEMARFLGEITLCFGRLLRGRARFRVSDLWLEIEEVGPRALVIVSVISFLVGLILAYLGADQLRMVGAQIFIADLVAIGMVREIGALMTGIIIAGRTGAAFAAQLGTMQVNEEIDAFRTLGVSQVDILVLPRILALMVMMPLLTLYASFVGMLAGLIVSNLIFDIGMFEYYTETLRALELKHFLVGLSKGTVYGAMVAFSGCLRGIQCGRTAEAVGRAATSAVVTGILLITISASLMTIIYYRLGI